MNKVRVIPVLLLKGWGLEKSIRFQDPVYVGCPINASRVFNRHKVDELILLDIAASPEGRGPITKIVSEIAEETFVPITVGGGVHTMETAVELLRCGADRVVLNTAAVEKPELVTAIADRYGRQCVVVSIDARRRSDGSHEVFIGGGKRATGLDPADLARKMEAAGAGEIMVTSIDRDGTMEGYDLELVRRVSDAVSIPVIACGGAGKVAHLKEAVEIGHASAVAAGALFLFFGPRRTVLINYPTTRDLTAHFDPGQIRPRS